MSTASAIPGLAQELSVTTRAGQATMAQPQTMTLERPCGPFVIDIWEARTPTDLAPVLLIHGWGGSGGYWRQTAEALAAHNRVIVPDLPGTGRSLPVAAPQDIYDQVATLGALLDELGLETVQVVGHSMGGAMSLLLTDAYPERVSRLVLTSTCFFLNEQQEQTYRAIMKFTYLTMRFRHPLFMMVPGMTRIMGARYFYRVPDDPALLRQGLADYMTLDLDTAIACADNATDAAIPAAGTRIRTPTLLIACRQDQVMPVENVDYTAATIPDSTVRWIEQCGHLPMVEKPAEYLAILQDFLDLE